MGQINDLKNEGQEKMLGSVEVEEVEECGNKYSEASCGEVRHFDGPNRTQVDIIQGNGKIECDSRKKEEWSR